jgi:carboxyl-terminal processing protease
MTERIEAIKIAIATTVLSILMLCILVGSLALPSAAVHTPSRHQKVYAKAWESIKKNYYDRGKLAAWENWRHKFDGKLKTKADLDKALNSMVDSLGDDYTFVLSDADVKKRTATQKSRSISAVKTLTGNIGYIKMDNFSGDNVVAEMRRALRTLAKAEGLILDLRNNRGGYVKVAQDVYSMLADEGTFMTYDGFAEGKEDDEAFVLQKNGWRVTKNGATAIEHRQPNLLGNKALIVLVNEDTRSASEMLAGALRDNGRAVIVGKQTYGKGVLQDTYEIGEHFLMKVVTARYFLPDGTNIHERGIEPDIELAGTAESQLSRAAQLLSSAIAEARASGRRVLAVIEQSAANL